MLIIKGGRFMAVHVVSTGESLWAISKMYSVPIPTLININGLPSANLIVPGLALYIPDNLLPIRTYRIKSGDLLWKLAQQFKTKISLILAANPGINPNQLFIGQVINIPSPLKLEIFTLGFVVPS